MTKKMKFIMAVFLIINIKTAAQQIDKYIAKVGNKNISEREFKIRYELVPHLSRNQFNEDLSKQDLLYSLIAEKLLSLEANRLGYDTTTYFKNSIQQIRNLYVRDALYKRVIDSKVKITYNDVQKALDRYSQSLEVKIISTGDSSQTFGYYRELRRGVPFDSIERITNPIEYDSNKAPIKITYGQMQDDYVEDTLYSLKVGNFSFPVKTRGGWFIFKLIGISNRIPPNSKDLNYDKKILSVLRMRKSRVIGIKYLTNFYKNKKAIVDSALFWKLTKKVSSILTRKKQNNDYGAEGRLYLSEGNLIQISHEFGNVILDKDIVHIKNNSIPLKEYLFSLIIYPFTIKNPSLYAIAYELMGNLNKYIQYKFLSAEGFREGLQYIPKVKEDIDIWKNDYLAKTLKNSFRDSVHVTDKELKNYYAENDKSEKVDILEILNNNLDVIETVFKELKVGENFRDLARKYTQRSWTKKRGGEFGYFPINSFGEIGKIAAGLKLNQVYGPIKTASGYSVIKLIGRKFDTTKITENFDSVKTQLKYSLLGKKFNKKFFKYIAKLADKYRFSINDKIFKNTKVLDIPMFTYKYIGFGGRITAMPYLGPWYGWIKYIKDKSKIIF